MIDDVLERLAEWAGCAGREWKEGECLISANEAVALRATDGARFREEVIPALADAIQKAAVWSSALRPPCSETTQAVMDSVHEKAEQAAGAGHFSSLSRAGVNFLRAHSYAYWCTLGGAQETCSSADKLIPIVSYRMGLNSTGEVWDMTPETLRRGLISGRKVPSFFKPVPAAALYKTWLEDVEAPVVWDPCGGFGARLLGFFAMYPKGTYIANEPATQTRADLETLARSEGFDARGVAAAGSYQILSLGSEIEGPACPVDMVFTSPPYFDKERYFDEPGQCWRDYPTEDKWVARYLAPTIQRGAEALKTGGHLVLNVDEARRIPVISCAEGAGLEFVQEAQLRVGADHFIRARGGSARSEPILVFRKTAQRITVSVRGTRGRYSVSNDGSMRSYTKSWKGTDIEGTVMSSGYRSVGLTRHPGGKPQTQLVHRLVCQAFHGDPPSPEHTDVRHLNGDKLDNRAENLAWGTRSENMLDVLAHRDAGVPLTQPAPSKAWYGGRTADSELVAVCVSLVHERKIEVKDVARLLGCSDTVASNLVTGRSQASTTGEVRTEKRSRRTPSRRAEITALIREGKTREEVNETLGEDLTHQAFYYYRTKAGC